MSGEMQKQKEIICDFALVEPAPNSLFSEQQRSLTKFIKYRKPVPCIHCGKKRKNHWTQLVFFSVVEDSGYVLKPSKEEYPPLSPVCRDHILQPLIEKGTWIIKI